MALFNLGVYAYVAVSLFVRWAILLIPFHIRLTSSFPHYCLGCTPFRLRFSSVPSPFFHASLVFSFPSPSRLHFHVTSPVSFGLFSSVLTGGQCPESNSDDSVRFLLAKRSTVRIAKPSFT